MQLEIDWKCIVMLGPAAGRPLSIATYIRALISQNQEFHQPLERDAVAAWKQFRFNWLLIAMALAIFDLCLLLTDFQIRPRGYLIALAVACFYGVCGYRSARSFPGRPQIFSMLTGFGQTTLLISVLTSVTYIAATAGLPLRDAQLLAIDQAIGFDFHAFLSFVNDRTWLVAILAFGYGAISWPICLIVLGLPMLGHYQRSAAYISAVLLALAVTCCISIIVPAIGVYHALGLTISDFSNIDAPGYNDTLRDLPMLRAGALRTLDLEHLGGVITFPSFHAAMAVLCSWALWPFRWVRPLNLAVNGAMLLATPVGGGHYLVDVLAGVTVAVGSIYAARYGPGLIDRLERRVATPGRDPIEANASC
ncbi:MAG: phosphatase PAP2 family protein [Bradyrhizobium sp.]|uniref:phosphatase PAP2 family protein n=1 Tax=Bradyrhizobium sp. TaxID=376 RepID=UPI003C7B1E71